MNHHQSLLHRKSVLLCQSLYICSRVHSGSLWSQSVQGSLPFETESMLKRKREKLAIRKAGLKIQVQWNCSIKTAEIKKKIKNIQQTYILVSCFVFEASDGHNVGPVIRLHGYTSGVRTGHVEGSGAVLIGALDAGTRHFLHPLPTVHAFLKHKLALCRQSTAALMQHIGILTTDRVKKFLTLVSTAQKPQPKTVIFHAMRPNLTLPELPVQLYTLA